MHELLVTCAKGIAPVLESEITDLGFPIVGSSTAAVETNADWAGIVRLCQHLRCAHRVLLRLKAFRCTHPDALYRHAKSIAWEDWIDPDGYFSVDGSAHTPIIRDTRLPNLKVKDAVCDRIRERTGRQPDAGSRKEGACVYVYWHQHEAAIYLDCAGSPLSRRGYRVKGGTAPLQEALAAAILKLADWPQPVSLVNPMCGSGTLAIEAAWMAQERPPGLLRDPIALKSLRSFDEELWRAGAEEGLRNMKSIDAIPRIIANDHDGKAVERAREHARMARVEKAIEFEVCDFRDSPLPEEPGIILMNPEYGVRMGEEGDLEQHYRDIGDWLKLSCSGNRAFFFTGNIPLSRKIGLKPSARHILYNGALECRLLEFPLFRGARDQQKDWKQPE